MIRAGNKDIGHAISREPNFLMVKVTHMDNAAKMIGVLDLCEWSDNGKPLDVIAVGQQGQAIGLFLKGWKNEASTS